MIRKNNYTNKMIKVTFFPVRSFQIFPVIVALFCHFPAFAEEPALSADQLVEALTAPPASVRFRGFKPKANPDAATRVCDVELNKQLLETSGKLGEQLTRTLYVEGTASIDLDIAFKRGEATLLPAGISQLDVLAKAISDPRLMTQKFVLAGHTDTDGGAEYNDRLSCERALSVRNYLRDQHKLDSARLVPMGFGYLKLKDPSDPRGEINRRVEVRRFPGLDGKS